jgi:hypothetical protein
VALSFSLGGWGEEERERKRERERSVGFQTSPGKEVEPSASREKPSLQEGSDESGALVC